MRVPRPRQFVLLCSGLLLGLRGGAPWGAHFPRFGAKFAQKRVFFHVFGSKMLQNHAFFYVLASELLKNTRFSTFWRQICSKTRVFPRFWLQNASKQRVFLRFGFRIAQKHAFFHVLASELLKNTRVSTFLASKRCVFHVFGFKTVRFSTFWLQNCSKTRVFQCFCFQSGSKLRVFPSFGFNIVQKRAFTKFFRYKLLQLFFDVFGLKRFKKTHFFPCVLFQNFAMQGVFFQRQAPLHTGASRTKAFTHRRFTHRQSTHRLFCTTNCFTHISFCTPKHLNTVLFTAACNTQQCRRCAPHGRQCPAHGGSTKGPC